MSEHEQLIKSYVVDKKSTHQIANEYKISQTKVRKILIDSGVKLRSRSESQKIVVDKKIKEGIHPTMGKHRSEEEKLAIGGSLLKYWDKNEKARKKMAKHAEKTLKKLPKTEKVASQKKATKGIIKASRFGSKLENFLYKFLCDKGLFPKQHLNMLENEKLEVDLYVPEHKTVIEVDGPSHYLPIWGQDKLEKQQRADKEKVGLLLSKGYNYIRLKHLQRFSKVRYLSAAQKVYDNLSKTQYIEIEV